MNEDELLMQYKLLQRADDKLDPFAKYYFQMGEREMWIGLNGYEFHIFYWVFYFYCLLISIVFNVYVM